MEWVWVLVLVPALILFGPVVFDLVRGRRWAAPTREDALGLTGYGAVFKDKAEIDSIGSR